MYASLITVTQHDKKTNQVCVKCTDTCDKSNNKEGTVVSCILKVQHLYLSVSVWLTGKKEKNLLWLFHSKLQMHFGSVTHAARWNKQWMKTSWVKKRRTKKKVKSPLKTNTQNENFKLPQHGCKAYFVDVTLWRFPFFGGFVLNTLC